MNFDFLNAPKSFLQSIYKKVEEKASKANMTVKDFLSKPGNRDHISLVVYDIFPLPIKLSLRYERFKRFFDENYEKFVVKMLNLKMSSESVSGLNNASNEGILEQEMEVVINAEENKKKKTKVSSKSNQEIKVKSSPDKSVQAADKKRSSVGKSIPVIMPSKRNGKAL